MIKLTALIKMIPITIGTIIIGIVGIIGYYSLYLLHIIKKYLTFKKKQCILKITELNCKQEKIKSSSKLIYTK